MENLKLNTGRKEGNLKKYVMGDWNLRGQEDLLKLETKDLQPSGVWQNKEQNVKRKKIVLDGNKFSDMNNFYREIELLFRNNPERPISYNLSTLHDLLRGGSSTMKYEEPIKLVWKNSDKSMKDLGLRTTNKWAVSESFFEILVDIIREHSHIELRLE